MVTPYNPNPLLDTVTSTQHNCQAALKHAMGFYQEITFLTVHLLWKGHLAGWTNMKCNISQKGAGGVVTQIKRIQWTPKNQGTLKQKLCSLLVHRSEHAAPYLIYEWGQHTTCLS